MEKNSKSVDLIKQLLAKYGYDFAVAIATQSEIDNGSACGQLSIIIEENSDIENREEDKKMKEIKEVKEMKEIKKSLQRNNANILAPVQGKNKVLVIDDEGNVQMYVGDVVQMVVANKIENERINKEGTKLMVSGIFQSTKKLSNDEYDRILSVSSFIISDSKHKVYDKFQDLTDIIGGENVLALEPFVGNFKPSPEEKQEIKNDCDSNSCGCDDNCDDCCNPDYCSCEDCINNKSESEKTEREPEENSYYRDEISKYFIDLIKSSTNPYLQILKTLKEEFLIDLLESDGFSIIVEEYAKKTNVYSIEEFTDEDLVKMLQLQKMQKKIKDAKAFSNEVINKTKETGDKVIKLSSKKLSEILNVLADKLDDKE